MREAPDRITEAEKEMEAAWAALAAAEAKVAAAGGRAGRVRPGRLAAPEMGEVAE